MNTKIIYEKQDLRNLSWTELSSTGWIGGSFLKAVDFQEKPCIKGVILNRISPMLYPRLKKVFEEEMSKNAQ